MKNLELKNEIQNQINKMLDLALNEKINSKKLIEYMRKVEELDRIIENL